jgi:hypothetical protein
MMDLEEEIRPPWKRSQKGNIYCMWTDLPEDLKPQFKEEHKFSTIIGNFHYSIKKNNDGSCIVFRKTKAEYEEAVRGARQRRFYRKSNRVTEIQAVPVEEANKLLLACKEYDLIGSDPVKVVDSKFFVILGRRESEDSDSHKIATR